MLGADIGADVLELFVYESKCVSCDEQLFVCRYDPYLNLGIRSGDLAELASYRSVNFLIELDAEEIHISTSH